METAERAQWDFSCPDWERCLRAGSSLIPPGLPLDLEIGNRATAMFDKLHLPDVPGLPLMRDAAGPWMRDLVRTIFGSSIAGKRMVREAFVMVPKKSAKTTVGAALTITAMLMNDRPRADFIYVGPTQEVADIAFLQTVGMIEADNYLANRFHVNAHQKIITDLRNKSRLKVKTFDMKVMTGAKPVWILLDELHIMSSISGASRILGQMRGGMLPFPEACMVMITTQSDEPPAGVFRSELQYARGVRDGRIKGSRMLPMLYEFPERIQIGDGKPWRNPKMWASVLPNLGRSITLDALEEDYAAAQEKGIEEEARWASQHLNIEIGIGLHTDRWIGVDFWKGAADTSITPKSLLERCDVVVAGIDGGGLEDLLGLALIGRDKRNRDWLLWTHAWAQPEVLDRRKEIAERLEDFMRDGDLTLCTEPTQDIKELVGYVMPFYEAGLMPEKGAIGFDPQLVAAIIDEFSSEGIPDEMMAGVAQGYKLSQTVWGTERKLKDGTLWHCGSKLMNWVASNAKVEQRGNAVLITKQVSGKAKIDPLLAAFDAANLMSRNPEPAHGNIDDFIRAPIMVI